MWKYSTGMRSDPDWDLGAKFLIGGGGGGWSFGFWIPASDINGYTHIFVEYIQEEVVLSPGMRRCLNGPPADDIPVSRRTYRWEEPNSYSPFRSP